MVRVAFELSAEDSAHAARQLALGRNTSTRVGVTLFIATFLVTLAATLSGGATGTAVLLAVVTIALILGVLRLALPAAAARKARRQHRKYPEFYGTYIYEFGAAGFTLTTPASRLELPWSVIERTEQDQRLLYLFAPAAFCYFVPLHALGDSEVAVVRAMQADARSSMEAAA